MAMLELERNTGQWYEYGSADERVAVRKDRGGRKLKNLIVNADDLGWTEGINRGIADAHRGGLVTSTSLLANGRAFESGVAVHRNQPELGVGVHLNLSDGPPTAASASVA